MCCPRAPEDLETTALERAADLPGHAPFAQTGNKRIIAALLEAQGELPGHIEHELINLRRASFASTNMREGIRGLHRAARAALERGVGS